MTAIAQALNAALLHFIWQGTLVACLLWVTLWVLRNRTANVRYLASCVALVLMTALPAITAWILYRHTGAIPIPSAIPGGTTAAVYAARIARQSAPLAWIAMWRQWTLPLWSVGVLVFALRLVLGCRHVAALRRLGHAAEGQIAETVAALARRMKARRAIRVLISTVAESPSVVGWLRPAILLPAATLAGLEPEQLQAVLAHEIAHIRRHDYLVNLAQTLVETLLFYHPAVWWASARIRHERELCCDDAAVAACGDAVAYARALTRLERLRTAMPQLALGSTGGSLLYRIQRLAGVKADLEPSKLPGIAALALGLACFAMTVHWAKAQQPMQLQAMPEEWGVTVSSTGRVLHRNRVPYPEATSKDGIQGTVTLEATLDGSGNVADAHVLSGPPELRKTALQSVLTWQFADGIAGETQQVSITFQPDARAQTEQQIRRDQTRLTEQFLKEELAAADKQGDRQAAQAVEEKLREAEEAGALVAQVQQQYMNRELDVLNRALEDSRKTLGERNPQIVALLDQIDALNRQLAQFKQAYQGKLRDSDGLGQTGNLLESQYEELQRQLAGARQSLSERNPEVVRLMAQVEALRKKIDIDSASFVGLPLARIEVSGVPDSMRDELATRLTVKIGEILSAESMDGVVAALRQFDQRLECRFRRATNGDVVLRITGLGLPK